MDKSFYIELSEMAQEAIDDLDRYEHTGITEQVFDKIRAVGVPCLDGQNLSPSVKEDIPIRDQLNFQRAIFSLAGLSTLSGGRGNNNQIKSHLNFVKSKALELGNKKKSKPDNITIFYSWQSSLPNKTNRGLIKSCLDKAIIEINKDVSIETRVSIDSDTSNTPGSPDIIHTILEKIDKSTAFIADVTLIDGKQPNSNVMLELGYAIKSIGDPNVIMIFNDSYGSTKNLPFDLGFKRQMIYTCSENEDDMSSIRKSLTNRIKDAIIRIVEQDK
ncbi:MAG: hypothetical protein ACXWE9_11755 [Methylobacter sp.]